MWVMFFFNFVLFIWTPHSLLDVEFFFLQFSSHRTENWGRGTYQWFDDCYEEYYFKNECVGFIRFPNTRKLSKARGCRPSALIVFDCLETLMKLNAQVLRRATQSHLRNKKNTEILTNFSHAFGKFLVVIHLKYTVNLRANKLKKKRKKTKNRQKKRKQKTTKTLG